MCRKCLNALTKTEIRNGPASITDDNHISFLQTGTFVEHTPTMGKSRSDLEVQGAKMSLFDMGGQKDFRKFWLGEMNETQLCIFVLDTNKPERFSEAKKELPALNAVIKKKL